MQNISEKILDVATKGFALAGYDGTSLSAIAKEVGIKKPSLLYHYPSKEQLRSAVLNRVFEHWNDELPRILKLATSGEDRFNGLLNEIVRFFVTDPNRARLVMREMLDRPDHLSASMEDYLGPYITILSDYIQKGVERGEVRKDVQPRAYVLHVIQMVVGGVATASSIGATSIEDHVSEIVRIARSSLFVDTPQFQKTELSEEKNNG